MQSIETWLPVPEYEGLYEVSDLGRVRSIRRRGTQGLVLKPWVKDSYGHLTVGLKKNDQLKKFYVHTLVMLAFVGPRPAGTECCHNDGNPANNVPSNLRWDTASSNRQDMVRHGRSHTANRTHCPRGHALVEPNLRLSVLRRGGRDCLACHRARANAAYRGQDLSPAEADAHYERIVSGL